MRQRGTTSDARLSKEIVPSTTSPSRPGGVIEDAAAVHSRNAIARRIMNGIVKATAIRPVRTAAAMHFRQRLSVCAKCTDRPDRAHSFSVNSARPPRYPARKRSMAAQAVALGLRHSCVVRALQNQERRLDRRGVEEGAEPERDTTGRNRTRDAFDCTFLRRFTARADRNG